MRLLLDTHTFLWWLAGSEQLSKHARHAISDEANVISISSASSWEIATKCRLGKLPGAEAIMADLVGIIADQGFQELAITVDDGGRAGQLPGFHRDPFDRMLIAQALARDMVLISIETIFDQYGVRRIWWRRLGQNYVQILTNVAGDSHSKQPLQSAVPPLTRFS